MKTVDMFKCLGILVCVVATNNVSAQSAPDVAGAASQDASKPHSGSSRAADHRLGRMVRRALNGTAGIDATNILVRVRGDAVTLLGTVPEGAQIHRAEDVAKRVPGVRSVSNRISLSPQDRS